MPAAAAVSGGMVPIGKVAAVAMGEAVAHSAEQPEAAAVIRPAAQAVTARAAVVDILNWPEGLVGSVAAAVAVDLHSILAKQVEPVVSVRVAVAEVEKILSQVSVVVPA